MSRPQPLVAVVLGVLLVAACGDAAAVPTPGRSAVPDAASAPSSSRAPTTVAPTAAAPEADASETPAAGSGLPPEPAADLWFTAGRLMGVDSTTGAVDDQPAWCEPGAPAHDTPLCRLGIAGLAWSPDGRRLAFTVARLEHPEVPEDELGLWTFTPADGAVRRLVSCAAAACDSIWSSPVWTDGGSSLAYVGGTWEVPELRIVDASTGEELRVLPVRGLAAPSPDGRLLAWIDSTGLYVDDGSGEPRRVAEGGGLALAWSPDGRFLSYGIVLDDGPVHARTYAWHLKVVDLAQDPPDVRELDHIDRCCKGGGVASAGVFAQETPMLAWHAGGTLRLVRLDTGEVRHINLEGRHPGWPDPAWRPRP